MNKKNFFLLSDLHLEFKTELPDFSSIKKQNSILCIAGDFGVVEDEKTYSSQLEKASSFFEKTFLVAGNHEYYRSFSVSFGEQKLRAICKSINEKRNFVSPVHFLQCESFDFDSGSNVRICGATLWTNIPGPKWFEAMRVMNDFARIGHWTPCRENEMHQKHKQFIVDEIERAKKDGKRLLILTHHPPAQEMLHPRFLKDEQMKDLNYLFASECPEFFRDNETVVAIFSGHSHEATSLLKNGILCCLNPRGYPEEEKETSFEIKCQIQL